MSKKEPNPLDELDRTRVFVEGVKNLLRKHLSMLSYDMDTLIGKGLVPTAQQTDEFPGASFADVLTRLTLLHHRPTALEVHLFREAVKNWLAEGGE